MAIDIAGYVSKHLLTRHFLVLGIILFFVARMIALFGSVMKAGLL